MVKQAVHEFVPDYVPPPGVTLRETLEFIGMSQAELARRSGKPEKTISAIASGDSAITPETAIKLERVLDVPASFWLNLQSGYDRYVELQKERLRLGEEFSWMSNFPLAYMIRLGWLSKRDDKVDQLNELLSFLGAASPDAWENSARHLEAAFRRPRNTKTSLHSLGAWLRKGEILGAQAMCSPYNETAFREALSLARAQTLGRMEDVAPSLNRCLNPCGVVVAMVHELPNAPVSGATRWLTPKKALIQLSLRYKIDDQFWFSFFHEAGHIALHHKRGVLIEDEGCAGPDEDEANRFAADALIPPAKWNAFKAKLAGTNISANRVQAFAKSAGVAPGIVVGRLQHEKLLPYKKLNSLKRPLAWASSASSLP
jgi:HTH-type transcriptional regulator/antitoxin HigA